MQYLHECNLFSFTPARPETLPLFCVNDACCFRALQAKRFCSAPNETSQRAEQRYNECGTASTLPFPSLQRKQSPGSLWLGLTAEQIPSRITVGTLNHFSNSVSSHIRQWLLGLSYGCEMWNVKTLEMHLFLVLLNVYNKIDRCCTFLCPCRCRWKSGGHPGQQDVHLPPLLECPWSSSLYNECELSWTLCYVLLLRSEQNIHDFKGAAEIIIRNYESKLQ